MTTTDPNDYLEANNDAILNHSPINDNEEVLSSPKVNVRVEESPSFFGSLAYSSQHVFLSVGALATYPIIIMKILCADSSDSMIAYHTAIISTCVFVAGLNTILQTLLGIRLPVFQGTSIAYIVATTAVMKDSQWKCPTRIRNSSDLIENGTFQNQSEPHFWYTDQDGIIRNSEDLWLRRIRMVQGAILVCSGTQMLIGLTGVIGYLTRFIGPLTIAPILIMLGYGIAAPCTDLCSINWGISAITIGVYCVFAIFMRNVQCSIPSISVNARPMKFSCDLSNKMAIFGIFPVVFATAVGWVAAVVWHFATPSAIDSESSGDVIKIISSTPWFRIPYPFQFGLPTVSAVCVLGMLSAVIPGILESVGDYNATASVCDEPSPPKHAINRGIFCEGVSIMLAGLFGTSNATTSWTANIPLISITKVASRKVFLFVGVIMIVLGIFPKSICIFAAVPEPVVGGVLLCLTGLIVSIGVSTLGHVDMTDTRNMFVLGMSILGGVVSSMYVGRYSSNINTGSLQIDRFILTLLGNSMFVSGILGFSLDTLLPGSRVSRGLVGYHGGVSSSTTKGSLSVYDLPFRTSWKFSSRIPICPQFGRSEAADI